jgi:hypothetical protein
MSKNIEQVFVANPITSNAGTDLMYFGQSPYGAGNDAAMLFSNFKAQFATDVLPSGDIFVGNASNVATAVAMSGDATLTNTGAITVTKTNGVAFAPSATTDTTNATNITTGLLSPSVGGTGVNNSTHTFTIGGNTAFSGAFAFTGTLTGTTTVTFPTSGTLATTSAIPSFPLSLANGGTNASLVASNGGIFYSTASAGAILSGTATANLPLLSGSTAAPTWGAFALSLGGALTTAGALITSGAFAATFTFTNTTSVTFPTSGTLATTAAIPSFPLSLANGGTNANLTASNGGIFYSTATAGAILSGTATANQVLLSGATATPAWSTATYPATTTINQLLYSSSANVIAGLATANSAMLFTTSAGVPGWTGPATNGQLLIGSTGASPTLATLTAGTNIGITNAAGGITINATGAASFAWTDVTGTSQAMVANNGYIADNAGLVTLTLPTTAAQGTLISICGNGAGGWKVAQNASQNIKIGSQTTTTGVGGSLASTNQYDQLDILCTVANTTWVVRNLNGNLTYV